MKIKLQPASGSELPAFSPLLPPAVVSQVLLLSNPHKVCVVVDSAGGASKCHCTFCTLVGCLYEKGGEYFQWGQRSLGCAGRAFTPLKQLSELLFEGWNGQFCLNPPADGSWYTPCRCLQLVEHEATPGTNSCVALMNDHGPKLGLRNPLSLQRLGRPGLPGMPWGHLHRSPSHSLYAYEDPGLPTWLRRPSALSEGDSLQQGGRLSSATMTCRPLFLSLTGSRPAEVQTRLHTRCAALQRGGRGDRLPGARALRQQLKFSRLGHCHGALALCVGRDCVPAVPAWPLEWSNLPSPASFGFLWYLAGGV